MHCFALPVIHGFVSINSCSISGRKFQWSLVARFVKLGFLLITFWRYIYTIFQRWFVKLSFFAYYFLKVHLHHFSKIKSHKEVSKQLGREGGGVQDFSYYYCLMVKRFGSGPLTKASGSGRPKNLRIRIRNTDLGSGPHFGSVSRMKQIQPNAWDRPTKYLFKVLLLVHEKTNWPRPNHKSKTIV